MAADGAAVALVQIATALELSQETQRQLLDLHRLLRERIESLEEELAALGSRLVRLEQSVQAGFDRLDADVDAIDGRVTSVHQQALRAANARYPGRNPA